jgi:hypothetical protein
MQAQDVFLAENWRGGRWMNFIAGEILGGCGDAKAAPPTAWQFCRAVSFGLGGGMNNVDKGVE